MNLLKNTFSPENINPENYKAVYYTGGGAAMLGVAENEMIQSISRKIYEKGGVISAICHGVAGIINLKLSNGELIYKGKQICGYSDDWSFIGVDHRDARRRRFVYTAPSE